LQGSSSLVVRAAAATPRCYLSPNLNQRRRPPWR
jgi:hypothetical protein